jgi:glycosyltransferase involved in cell wall biosynthesis
MWICQKLGLFLLMEQLSVITICFNNLSDLNATCDSVDNQSELPFEHYIINGSTNTEIENWLNQTPQPPYRKWVNEPDKGISDAFNKGVQRASGTILHLLNSGDCYFDQNVLNKVHTCFNNHPTTQWISGNIFMNRNGSWVTVGVPFDPSQLYKGMRSVSHPTWFLRKEVYDRGGVFSLSIKIAMDYDLLCRLSNEKYFYLNETIARFDDKGVSTTQYVKSLKDNIKVYESYHGFSYQSRFWQMRLKMIFYLMQTGFGKWLYKLKSKI